MRVTDDYIDKLYAHLCDAEHGRWADEKRAALLKRWVYQAEQIRADEMAAYAEARNPLKMAYVEDVFRRVDEALSRPKRKPGKPGRKG